MTDVHGTEPDRGRDATTPLAITLRGYFDIAMRVQKKIGHKNLSLLAAGVAFYSLLSLFPGLTALVALGGMLISPDVLVSTSENLAEILPEAAQQIIMGQLISLAGAEASALNFAAILALSIAVFSASRAVQNVIAGLNVVYDQPETRGFFRLTALNIGMTLSIMLGLLLAVTIVAGIPTVVAFASLPDWTAPAVAFIRWPILFGIGATGIAVLYRFGPDRRAAKWRWITPGALLACALWVAGSVGFSSYVQSFGSYNETFGALGGVIVLLTWLWLSAFVLLFGALIDAETEAQTTKDSTVGKDRPMGDRGAVKADTVGPAQT